MEAAKGEEASADSCKACQMPVHVKNLVFDGEHNWHQRCFTCRQCNSSLVNQKYYEKEGEGLFCSNCFLAKHLPTCFACREEIKGSGGVKMEAGGGEVLTWHQACLTCSVCCQAVGLDNVVFKASLFCKMCYIQSTLDRCEECSKPITGVGFGFRGKFWHDTCFGCDNCQQIFSEGKFHALREQKLCPACLRAAAGLQ
jgi:LIM domain-containing protein 2